MYQLIAIGKVDQPFEGAFIFKFNFIYFRNISVRTTVSYS